MSSLLRMTDEELQQHEAGGRFALVPALGLSAAAGVLAFAGMWLKYSPGDEVPVTGMDYLNGQIALSFGLGIIMLATAYTIRSVVVKRLQWAVLFSLMIHLMICVGLRTVRVDVPLTAVAEVGDSDHPMREFTIPDYGGAESISTEPQEWERPNETDAHESQQHQLQRQTTEVTPQAEPDEVEIQRQIEMAAMPERQRQQEQMDRAIEVEIQRQNQQARSDAPEQLPAPEVETPESQQPDLEAAAMERSDADLTDAERQQQDVENQNTPQIDAARLAARSEMRPQQLMQLEVQPRQRQAAAAATAETNAEAVEIAPARDARQLAAQMRATEAARQADSSLNDQQRTDMSSPSSSSQTRVESVSPSRAASAADVAVSAPSSGGAAALQRSTSSSGRSTSAASTSAESVEVAAAVGAGSPALTANSSASNVARGSSSVPSGAAGGGGAPSMRLSQSGVSALESGTVGRGRGSQSGPKLGDSVNAEFSGGSGPRGSADGAPGAVGTRAQEVTVGSVAGGAGSSEQVLSSGPSSAASGAGRSGGGLPASSGSSPGEGVALNGTTGSNRGVAMNAAGRAGLSGAASESGGARLRGDITGGRGLSGSGRSSRGAAAISLPAGALQAEQSGALVYAGPQEGGGSGGTSGRPSASRGTLIGPRSSSVARRAAGLPGSGRGSTSIARTKPSLPGGLSAGRSPARSSTGGPRPSLATSSELAGLIKRNVPGISNIHTERISAAFSMRTPDARAEAVAKLGGNDQSEAAVERGLQWLAAHQYAAGNWSIHAMNCEDHDCGQHGTYDADPAATGLALLAFLGAGHTHETGDHKKLVQRGLDWLIKNQTDEGDLFAAETEFARFYSHGIAAIALCEAYGMTKDRKLQEPAQKAIEYIVKSQHPEFGGWRYKPRFESDTSVSGWQLMAMKSGQMAGLNIPKPAYDGVRTWLDSVEDTSSPGRFAYHPTRKMSEPMTAEGLLMRQYLGAGRTDSAVTAGAEYLKQRLPRSDARNVYYWYYGTQVMFHMQGEYWDAWNAALRDMLVETQENGGPTRGSWAPENPTKDTWGRSGGRHYVTCLNLLMLEVYYRHLPLYIELTP